MMKWNSNRSINLLLLLFFSIIIYVIGFHIPRTDFSWLIISFIAGFAILGYWLKSDFFDDEKMIWIGAMVPRIILLFSIPLLSDDYFRFIWDGQLLNMGVNPFSSIPADINGALNNKIVYEGLNSKHYFSVYPPVMQFCFWLSSFFSGDHIFLNIFLLKLIVFIGEAGVIYFAIKILKKLNLKVKSVIIYALNPMIIVETIGNLHFEGLMMCFTLWAIYLLIPFNRTLETSNLIEEHSTDSKRGVYTLIISAFIFSLGVSTKMISLLFLIPLVRKLGSSRSTIYMLLVGLFSGMSFLFFIDQNVIDNFSNSLDLYFRNFEFNASIYFLANWLYAKVVGWQEIKYVGPILAGISTMLILFLSFRRKINTWEKYFLIVLAVLSVHLIFSTTVHPWYVINLIVASIFTKYRSAIIWSFAILLSYYFYKNMDLPTWIIILEYLLVLGYMGYEFFQKEISIEKS